MFKKLKEKKELETHLGFNNINKRESIDENSLQSEDNYSINSCDEQRGDELATKHSVLNIKDNENNISLIESLNEQIIKLKNELVIQQNLNSSLESQVIQLKNDNQFINNELNAKTEENRQLKTQLCEYQSIGGEKDDLLFRNAQLSNQLEQLRQDLEEERVERLDMTSKLDSLKQSESSSTVDKRVSHLNETIVKLEESLNDKNKTIKLQQQKLFDIKKTFHKNLQNLSNREETAVEESPKHLNISSIISETSNQVIEGLNGREINLTYLRNVVFKYMISSEYEAIHLVKAIAMLLNFSKDEEKLIKETIEWKMSWFAPLVAQKPSLTNRK